MYLQGSKPAPRSRFPHLLDETRERKAREHSYLAILPQQCTIVNMPS